MKNGGRKDSERMTEEVEEERRMTEEVEEKRRMT